MPKSTFVNLASGIWFSMSNKTLVLALLVMFVIGFVVGYFVAKRSDRG